ncbi:MAG: hypothetical protein OHK0012_18890 [Synechococcales cyanobacterium]
MAPRVTGDWPLEAFVGDVLVFTLSGEHLAGITGGSITPMGKHITIELGDPLGRLGGPAKHSDTELTLTITIGAKTYAGEKRVLLHSPEGDSQPLPLLVMM